MAHSDSPNTRHTHLHHRCASAHCAYVTCGTCGFVGLPVQNLCATLVRVEHGGCMHMTIPCQLVGKQSARIVSHGCKLLPQYRLVTHAAVAVLTVFNNVGQAQVQAFAVSPHGCARVYSTHSSYTCLSTLPASRVLSCHYGRSHDCSLLAERARRNMGLLQQHANTCMRL